MGVRGGGWFVCVNEPEGLAVVRVFVCVCVHVYRYTRVAVVC
jgi:hypothetical protein